MTNKGYNVIMVDLPYAVPSMLTIGDDGEPVILINARYDTAAQRDALDHEIDHDRHNDLTSDESIIAVETRGRAS